MASIKDTGLSGAELRRAFLTGFDRLEEYRDTVNALNVFPVPDGDTGTNMSLTLRSGIERCPDDDGMTAGEVARELAQGTFFGARGNSGVILSQFFKGFGDALEGCETCSAAHLAQALDRAREAAYSAVGNPREGTMLTVIRRAAEAALESGEALDLMAVLEIAYLASCVALKNTPEQLPVLKEAGVVDSGGLGVVVILGGVLAGLAPERSLDLNAEAGLENIIDDSMASLGGSSSVCRMPDSCISRWKPIGAIAPSSSSAARDSARRKCGSTSKRLPAPPLWSATRSTCGSISTPTTPARP